MDRLDKYDKAIQLKGQGLSCPKIAELIECPTGTVQNWCNGKIKRHKIKNRYLKNDDEFAQIVKNNYSIRSIILECGLVPAGGNYRTVKDRIERLNLNIDHFTGMGHLKGKTHNWAAETDIKDAFVVNGTMQSFNLNKKIRKHNLKPYCCSECSTTEWNGQELSLQLDHINGINNDNRLENLRFLCPNCHSLTKTYAGKNKKK